MTETAQRATVVAVQGLTKVFKDFWLRTRARAVDNVSFHLEQGEVFGLLGPNGSGKSTTIKILLGLLHPTRGRVAVFGRPPTEVAVKKRIGYLPEESYLYPFLNARETLDYYGKLFQLDARVRRRRIDELLDMVGLSAVQHRLVREYSKGMQRRIGIAQALINDPDLLILDEPTTGLDPIGTRQIKDLIIMLGRRGKSILLSSHLLADVEDCVDRMVILYGGRVQREGTCEQLLTSQRGTVLETDALDDETVAAIDRLIRERSGGERALARVSRPRQSLEALFIDIVEQAQRANLDTSGARHGGVTASFLAQGAGEHDGRALIDRLTRDTADAGEESANASGATTPPTVDELLAGARRAGGATPASGGSAGADAAVIASLVEGSTAPGTGGGAGRAGGGAGDGAGAGTGAGPSGGAPAEVDRSVIGSLLGEPPAGGEEAAGGKGRP